MRERAVDAFDVVYVPPGINVQLFVETEIPLTTTPRGRQLRYTYAEESPRATLINGLITAFRASSSCASGPDPCSQEGPTTLQVYEHHLAGEIAWQARHQSHSRCVLVWGRVMSLPMRGAKSGAATKPYAICSAIFSVNPEFSRLCVSPSERGNAHPGYLRRFRCTSAATTPNRAKGF